MQFLPLTLRLPVYNSALGANTLPYCRPKVYVERYPRTYSQCSLLRVRPANQIQIGARHTFIGLWPSTKPFEAKLGCSAKLGVQSINDTWGYSRGYPTCCSRRPPNQCGCPIPGGGRKIVPPTTCRPGPIPPNPCVPVHHHGKDTWKRYKYIFFLFCLPLIIIQAMRALSHEMPHKGECRDYEYMRLRSKRFPWGQGEKSLFHNDHTNHLPGECVPPPLDCD